MSSSIKLKTDEGSTIDLIQILIGILALLFMIIINASITSTVDKRSSVELVVHEYIMRMETEGCLTPDAKTLLTDTLTDLGMKDIVISATNSVAVYGDRIKLTVSGNLETEAYNMAASGFTMQKGTNTIPVNITKTSVSRYAD